MIWSAKKLFFVMVYDAENQQLMTSICFLFALSAIRFARRGKSQWEIVHLSHILVASPTVIKLSDYYFIQQKKPHELKAILANSCFVIFCPFLELESRELFHLCTRKWRMAWAILRHMTQFQNNNCITVPVYSAANSEKEGHNQASHKNRISSLL